MAYFSATGTSGGSSTGVYPNILNVSAVQCGSKSKTIKVCKNDIIFIGYVTDNWQINGDVEIVANAHAIYNPGKDIVYKASSDGNVTITNTDTFYALIYCVITKNGRDIDCQATTTTSNSYNTFSNVKEGELFLGFSYNHNLTLKTDYSNNVLENIFNMPCDGTTSTAFYLGAVRAVADADSSKIFNSYYVTRTLRLL